MKYIMFFFITFVTRSVYTDQCLKPEVTASAYITEDATILTHVAFTTQFTLKCINGVKGISLYAEVNGKALPAIRLSTDNKYQVLKLFEKLLIPNILNYYI
jgi:translocon-associated protein subunit delta